MSTVNTTRGRLDSGELGRTLSDEHLTIGFTGMENVTEPMLARRANPAVWTLVPKHEMPWLLATGPSEADVEAMLAGSIRRTFEAPAGTASD